MKRILLSILVVFNYTIAMCQNNDTIWCDDFTTGVVNGTYWNYETGGITDLVMYRPESVTIKTVWNRHTGCYILCNHETVDGYRFTSGGVNTKDKVTVTSGQTIDCTIAFPTGEFPFGEEYMEGHLAKSMLVNTTDTIGFIFDTDYPQSLHAVVIFNGVRLSDISFNKTYAPYEFHKYSIALCENAIYFYIDNNLFSSVPYNIENNEFWYSFRYDVLERGQAFAHPDDCVSTEDFFVECYPTKYYVMLKDIAIVNNHSCENIGDALSDVPADELLAVSDGVLTLKGVAEGTASAVFTPDGQRVMTFTGDKTDISSLPSGLYILRTGTLTAKFVK